MTGRSGHGGPLPLPRALVDLPATVRYLAVTGCLLHWYTGDTRLTGAICQLDLASHRDNFPKVNWHPLRVKHLACTRPKTNSDVSDAAGAAFVAYIGRDKLPTRSGSRPKIAASFHLPMASATNPLHGPTTRHQAMNSVASESRANLEVCFLFIEFNLLLHRILHSVSRRVPVHALCPTAAIPAGFPVGQLGFGCFRELFPCALCPVRRTVCMLLP